jgi:hypothetical protein
MDNPDPVLEAFKAAKKYDSTIQYGIPSENSNRRDHADSFVIFLYIIGFVFLLGCAVGLIFLLVKLIKFFWYF